MTYEGRVLLSSKQVRGSRVRKANGRKAGKVKEVLFAPAKQQVIGYVVSRGDFLLMFKRKDRFLAYDRVNIAEDGLHAREEKAAWGQDALKRLGVSYDDAVVWRGMPVMTQDGREVGRISDLAYSEESGKLLGVRLSDGALATALLGRKDIPASLIVSCTADGVVVQAPAVAVEASGGVVDVAAQASVYAGDRITKGAQAAAKTATKAADAVTKHTSGMFSSFRDEYKKALEDDDES